jgi:DNA-binding transcriptional MocR family regulator
VALEDPGYGGARVGRRVEQAIIAAARARSVGLYGMSTYRSTRATTPPQLVLGFGDLTEGAVRTGIAAIADLRQGRTTADARDRGR